MALSSFTWDPSYTYVEDFTFPIETIEYESGKETRLLRGVSQRSFTLQFDKVTTTVKDEILAFFNSRRGRAETFYWTNPNDSIIYEVCFSDDGFSAKEQDYGYWDIEFKLVEKI